MSDVMQSAYQNQADKESFFGGDKKLIRLKSSH